MKILLSLLVMSSLFLAAAPRGDAAADRAAASNPLRVLDKEHEHFTHATSTTATAPIDSRHHVALNAGEQHVDAGTAVMLIQVSPVLVALLAATFLHERFTLYLGLGLALAFAGVALIATASGHSSGDRTVLGVVLP